MESDIKEIKAHVIELVKQGAVHNTLLQEHERRSIALEKRQDVVDTKLEPITDHVKMVSNSLKVLGGLALLVIGQLLLKWAGLL